MKVLVKNYFSCLATISTPAQKQHHNWRSCRDWDCLEYYKPRKMKDELTTRLCEAEAEAGENTSHQSEEASL